MKSVLIQGFLYHEDTTSDVQLCRVMLLYDTQANGAVATISSLLTSSYPTAPMNLANRDRYRIIADKWLTLGILNNTATQSVADKTVNLVHKFKKLNLDVTFGGTSNLIASINTGALYLVTVGSSALGSGAVLTCNTRVRFNDA